MFCCLANGHVCSRLLSDSWNLNNLSPGSAVGLTWRAVGSSRHLPLPYICCKPPPKTLWFHGKIWMRWNACWILLYRQKKQTIINLLSHFKDPLLTVACPSAMLPGNERERKQNSLPREESGKARSETENLAYVQSLRFMLVGLWKSEALTGSQIWSDGVWWGGRRGRGGDLWGQIKMQQKISDEVRQNQESKYSQ